MLQKIFTEFHPELIGGFIAGYPTVIALMVLGFVVHFLPTRWNDTAGYLMGYLKWPWQVVVFVLLLIVLVQVKGSEVQPFIYLQF